MSDDSAGATLFGVQPPPASGYLVLARKYRPRTFEDLIGQEAMVRTIANAFALNRIPHATMLTGVRGVGKTTTARLLARALNYESDTVKQPSVKLDPPGVHCALIQEGRHTDVLEMDAASRTGIADIREILEAVRYAPAMARYKVYVIDEVHMLSTAAFNGLLKTLEEPPPHVKFVFATTEIRKVPVTVLSRCQRFDLRRVPADRLAAHLAAVCAKEGMAAEPEALALIARAAEGSVRDALSLLDQALVQRPEGAGPARVADVRDMLGLADRGRVLDLFVLLLRGDAAGALSETRAQYEQGADPALLVRDLLDSAHEITRMQALGDEAGLIGAADHLARVRELAGACTPGQLSRLWQLLMKALEETTRAPEPIAAAEMAMVRIATAQTLPPPEDAARMLREAATSPASGAGASQPRAPDAGPRASVDRFEDVVALVARKRELALQIDLEKFVRVLEFAPGRLRFAAAPGAPADLASRLGRALREWTGEAWTIEAVAAGGGADVESLREREQRLLRARLEAAAKLPFVAEALAAFPGAAVIGVEDPAPAESAVITPFPADRRARKEA